MDNSKLSVLKTFSSAGEASIYQSLLESNGIRCELLNEGISDILPIPGDLSKIRLVVNEADAAKAEEDPCCRIRSGRIRHGERQTAQEALSKRAWPRLEFSYPPGKAAGSGPVTATYRTTVGGTRPACFFPVRCYSYPLGEPVCQEHAAKDHGYSAYPGRLAGKRHPRPAERAGDLSTSR